MRFHPDSDQVAIQDAVKGTLEQVFPRDRMMAFIEDPSDHDEASWTALMELGLSGLMLEEADGGAGLGLFEAALVMEELGRGAAPGALMGQLITTLACQLSDTAAAKEFLPQLLTGETIATFAFGGNWLPESWTILSDDGVLTGQVPFVPCGNAASLFLVGTSGGGLALARKSSAVTVNTLQSSDRTRPSVSLRLDGAEAISLFEPGDRRVQRLFDAALILVAADALGGAQYCTDLSVSYAQDRHQFGQPIGRFQALKHQLATMAMNVESARSLVWYAAYAWDKQLADASRSASLAKAHLCDQFTTVSRDAIASHGGIGYTWEYGLNVWFRRSIFNRAVLGSPTLHRARSSDLAGW